MERDEMLYLVAFKMSFLNLCISFEAESHCVTLVGPKFAV